MALQLRRSSLGQSDKYLLVFNLMLTQSPPRTDRGKLKHPSPQKTCQTRNRHEIGEVRSKFNSVTSQGKGLGCFGAEIILRVPVLHHWHVSGSKKEPSSEEVSVPVAGKSVFATTVKLCQARLEETQF